MSSYQRLRPIFTAARKTIFEKNSHPVTIAVSIHPNPALLGGGEIICRESLFVNSSIVYIM